MSGNKLNIGIVGGGAVGLTYAALLSEVANVHVIVRQQSQADQLNEKGIQFETRQGEKKHFPHINASTEFSDLKDCDTVIVAVKSYDTEKVADAMNKHLKDDAIVVTLQNGIQAFDVLQSKLTNPDRVMAGVTYVGASRKDSTTVINGTSYNTIVDSRARQLIDAIGSAYKLEVQPSDNIKQVVWDKMVLNVGQNALSAVTNLNFGEMYQSSECLARAEKLLAEFKKVGEAEGLRFDYDLMEKLKDNWRGSTFYPSMWQDLHQGKRTEIDAINGAISQLGKKHGIKTPYNDEIVLEIKALEKNLGK